MEETISHMHVGVNLGNFWAVYSPRRFMAIARNSRVMGDFLLPHIRSRIAPEAKAARGDAQSKTVVDLALKHYKEEQTATGRQGATRQPDTHFVDVVVAQLKSFVFAGYETTAATICWALHEAYRHKAVLARLRAEHDAVLGPTAAAASLARVRADPRLVHALPYTAAVVKETMRLYPVGATIRTGGGGFRLAVDGAPAGWPTAGFSLWTAARGVAMCDGVFVRPAEFLPERWLAGEGQALHPPRAAFQGFSMGPRACIGQELATVEMKLVLVAMVRDFDLECAWEEWDALR
jgi:cytochrome P450